MGAEKEDPLSFSFHNSATDVKGKKASAVPSTTALA